MARIGSPCSSCHLHPSKYRCPGCSFLSCSLPCIKSHKLLTSCTGKRPITQVPIDSTVLTADYGLLQDTERLVDASKRIMEAVCGARKIRRTDGMHKQSQSRHFRLFILPGGMERAKKNKTRYIPQKKSILWTVEWIFHSTTNITIIDHDVDEHTIMSTVITKHLELPQWRQQLKPFCKTQLEDLNFFLKKNEKNPKAPFRKLDVNGPIGKQLVGTTILEYPVIHVYLPSESYDFIIDKWRYRVNDNRQSRSSLEDERMQSPQGIPPREEEIEEGEASPTRFLDLRVNGSSGPSGATDILENILSMDNVGSSNYQLPQATGDVFKLAPDDGEAFLSDEGDWYTKICQAVVTDADKQLTEFNSEYPELETDDFLSLNGIDEKTEKSLYFAKQFLLGEELEEGEISS